MTAKQKVKQEFQLRAPGFQAKQAGKEKGEEKSRKIKGEQSGCLPNRESWKREFSALFFFFSFSFCRETLSRMQAIMWAERQENRGGEEGTPFAPCIVQCLLLMFLLLLFLMMLLFFCCCCS
ncbi:MAG: hypothetical protein J3R72DRAFT_144326 [Linnemannia gamsii]|nr:MAG: hypothetical protein J3R72DRAFT_144326 [Linnemannia gamsii]